jgi:hypothetical protein
MVEHSENIYRIISSCRSCKGKNLAPYLDLGITPLANRLIKLENFDQKEPHNLM